MPLAFCLKIDLSPRLCFKQWKIEKPPLGISTSVEEEINTSRRMGNQFSVGVHRRDEIGTSFLFVPACCQMVLARAANGDAVSDS